MAELPLEDKKITTVEGVLERVVFASEETGWSVVRVLVPERVEPITAVGNLLGVQPGENLRLTGAFVQNRKYGQQLEVTSYLSVKPATLVGIERYLASGLVPGIGPAMAKRLVEHFGMATLEVIEQGGHRLKEVDGIGPIRATRILEAWTEQRDIKNVMVFLQSHGVSTAYAVRIFKRYGANAIATVRANPYQLAADIFGIGFASADRIAQSIGIDRTSPRRAEAGVLHALGALAEEGNVYAPRSLLVERAEALLEVERAIIDRAIVELAGTGAAVCEQLDGGEAVYSARLHQAEVVAAQRVRALLASEPAPIQIDVPRALTWYEGEAGITLGAAQRRALQNAIEHKVSVITGGPGTGKTTILNGLLRVLEKKGRRILLAAPTGRAAKRLQETTGREAKTLHRLLEFDPKDQRFARDDEQPLEADMLIVDESSMVDLPLFANLLRAVPSRSQLVLVGDVDQLPSVGPGSVLRDVIQSGRASVTVLDQIFRQGAQSLIVVNAHRINRGELPELAPVRPAGGGREEGSDFYLIEREEPDAVLATIKELVQRRIPARFGVDPVDDIQVLTPMHRGSLGAANLNAELQALLNPEGDALARGERLFRTGDKVMQLRNNYDLDVFNGDVGRIASVDLNERSLVVRFDEREVRYDPAELDELALAYACSIHKSQGSEYPVVIVPVSTQHYVMLERNLLYTAVTRGKRLVVLVGSARAIAIAVKNRREQRRFSDLARRISTVS